jgi:hypothetical protein
LFGIGADDLLLRKALASLVFIPRNIVVTGREDVRVPISIQVPRVDRPGIVGIGADDLLLRKALASLVFVPRNLVVIT